MERERLTGMRAKLERADEHQKVLTEECAHCFASGPVEYKTDADLAAETYVVRLKIKTAPPLRLATICGDFVQNLRAALDHLANALVQAPLRTKQTQFPTYSDKNRFNERVLGPAQRASRVR